MWAALIHNALWHRWLASPRVFKTSCRLRFVGSLSKAKRWTETHFQTPRPCKDTFMHILPYRILRPLAQHPVHIRHCPLSDSLDLLFSFSIMSNLRASIFSEKCQHCIMALILYTSTAYQSATDITCACCQKSISA